MSAQESKPVVTDGKLSVGIAKGVAIKHGLRQVLLIGFDGEQVHVVTYGKTKKDCEAAAKAQDFWTGKIREFSFKDDYAAPSVSAQDASPKDGWQPIETAPKGPKIVVAYKNALGKWRRVMARYYADEQLENDDLDSDLQYAPAGWYEESETHCEHLQPVAEPPLLWSALLELPK